MRAESSVTRASRRRRARSALRELASRARAARLFIPLVRMRELSERLVARHELARVRGEAVHLSPAAWGVLVEAHRRGQAELLSDALELSLWSSIEGRAFARDGLVAPREAAWRIRLEAELGAALELDMPFPAELLACGLLAREAWPGPGELARAAAKLEAGARSLLDRTRAELFEAPEGRGAAAGRALLRRGLGYGGCTLRDHGLLHRALALAAEARGELELALSYHERGVALAPCPRASLATFVLGLELDRRRATEVAWRSLEASWRGSEALAAPLRDRLWRELFEGRRSRGVLVPRRVASAARRELEGRVPGADE